MTTVASRTGNLPAAFTSFVGRQPEVAEIGGLLRTARLATLTGPGGVGKTRLALEVAAGSANVFPDGVWLVNLAPVQEPAALAGVAAAILGVPELGALSVVEQLARYMAQRRALIVLDNCEHLASACAELAKSLLSAAPELHILATSRHALGLTGEHIFAVAPLSPAEAAGLLQDRAGAVRPGFRISDTNQAQVSRLCADLDGLPLAIELAASRLRTLTVGQVVDRLADRFALLTSGDATAWPHQHTLRKMIDWSYELCTTAERLLWNRLSIFAGGFDLDAVESVCAGDGIAEHEVLDLLDRLVAQSVVLTTEGGGLPRFRLLETIRQYGREKLAASGEEERLLLRHRDFFLTLAQRVDQGWFGPGQAQALNQLRAEHTNLLAALDCDADPQIKLVLAAALGFHWCAGGFLSEGRRQFDRALAAAPECTLARGRALLGACWVALTQGDLAAADRWLDEAEALAEQLGDPELRAQVSGFRGLSAHYRGQPKEGMAPYEDARAALMALGNEREATSWHLSLACVQAYTGDPRAAETGRQVIAAFEASGERWGHAQVLTALGHNAWERGDREAAKALARSALENMRGFNDCAMIARMLELLAWATASDGTHEWAARLLGAADALWKETGSSIHAFGPRIAEHHARCEKAAADVLGLAAYLQALAEGSCHDSPSQAIEYALASAHEPVSSATAPGPLTSREREVAALVAKGLSNRQIASTLRLSPRTADRHVQNILGKLGFGCRAQIASWWSANPVPTEL
ncbi:ATP-binding protein [Streptomyces arenae]|uniref:ATP-binding protein n=1 Tax=Streptomyces arenae TaxID=29301 RepID=UPI002659C92F|nr:LuxR C-terminal-related transcriptional regulator [Streptomyces arenae]MCG7210073.1 LuxR C-terminal-related transcriptional regulator [Streptomyces arenae]